MVRLAEFLGIPCETLALSSGAEHAGSLRALSPGDRSCLVVNSQVIKELVSDGGNLGELATTLLSRFPQVIVYGFRVTAFDAKLVTALSRGKLKSVDAVDNDRAAYEVAADSKNICEAFSGLAFGPVNTLNDHVLGINGNDPEVNRLISIGGRPFVAAVKLEGNEVLFIAGEDVADLDAAAGEDPLATYFSKIVPYAMALRYVAGDECWRPGDSHASIIVDDPLLRKSYGYLNFESLLRFADHLNFHATIAFIPHNFRRNSFRIARMFRENAARLSICFHGNDHTEREFASTDRVLLNTLLDVAETRMSAHHDSTGITCDKVMVFPQGKFSVEAMHVLKSRNFYAAVNTIPHPAGDPLRLTIGELAQPAVLRYAGFPLFLRRPSHKIENFDIAFNAFFGRPVLIVEHHDIFRSPDALQDVILKINTVVPGVRWSNLANVVSNSMLKRVAPDGTVNVRAYSGTVRISNDSKRVERYSLEWSGADLGPPVDRMLSSETPSRSYEIEGGRIRASVKLAAGDSETLSIAYRNDDATLKDLGLRWNTKAFVRRRLSEVRDNHLSKSPRVLAVAKALQKRLKH
jgi:hypothetical protein